MRTRHNRTVESTVISSRRVLLTDGQFHAARIELSQGRISSISALGHDETPTTDLTLAAGFIDLQVNGIDDVDVHHRHVAVVRVRDELPPHQPVGRGVGGELASVALGAVDDDLADGGRARIFLTAGLHHFDDRTHYPAAAEGCGF